MNGLVPYCGATRLVVVEEPGPRWEAVYWCSGCWKYYASVEVKYSRLIEWRRS